MRLRTIILLLLVTFPFLKVFGQKIDSLLVVLSEVTSEEDRYEILSEIVTELENTDRTKVTSYGMQMLTTAESLNDLEKVGNTTRLIGRNYLYLNKNDSAYIYLQKSYDIFENLRDSSMMYLNLGNIALVYQRLNEYEKAVGLYTEVIEFSKLNNNYYSACNQMINLSSIFIDQEEYDLAIQCLIEIEEIYPTIPENHEDKPKVNNLFPLVYINLGICYTESESLKDYQKAQNYYDQVILSTENLESTYAATYYSSYAYKNKGDLFAKDAEERSIQNNNGSGESSPNDLWKEAKNNFELALDGFKNIENPRGIIFSKNSLGLALAHLEKNIQSRELLIEALVEAKSNDFKEEIRDAYQNMSYNEEMQGNSDLALGYYKNFVSWKDSIRNEDRDEIISQLQTEFRTKEKENEIVQLAAANEIQARKQMFYNVLFISAILGILGMGYLWYTRYKYKQQVKVTEFEKILNQAMAKFVPMKFINALGKDRITDVNLGDQIEKEVSVVFTDIRGFTSISEKLTPSENFKLVKDYSEAMGPIILKNNGFINQYMGDGIMAIFDGTPDDALNACIEMQKAVEIFSKTQNITDSEIRVGMGIHTGNLVLGIIGDENRRDAALISDTVNSAARMESSTKTYGARIIISDESVNKLKNSDNFNMRYIGEYQAKGKEEPLKLYECFDVDLEDIKKRKTRTKPILESALTFYKSGNYAQAIGEFQKIIDMNPGDVTTQKYLEMAEKNIVENINN